MTTFVEEENNTTTTTALAILSESQFDELNKDIIKLCSELEEANTINLAYQELNKQYLANKDKIKELSNQKFTTRDLIAKIYDLERTTWIKHLIARRNYFSMEFEKRTLAIEKYSDNRGFVLTKAERKERYSVDLQLAPLTKLEEELKLKNKINEAIKTQINDLEMINRQHAVKLRKQSESNKTLLEHIETIKNKLQYLQTFQKNQLTLKKCLSLIKEKHIFIDEEDDYEDIKNKCVLNYVDTLKYRGKMFPLCINEECDGVDIGYSCRCGKNKNIWFTLEKPKSYDDFIPIADMELFPEFNDLLGYLITRDNSIDEYLKYAKENNIYYYNYTDLFVSVNDHHHDMLKATYCIPCDEYPKNYGNYDSDNACDEYCYFDINSDVWTCSCGNRQFVWEDEDFNPMTHSLLNTKPEGSLRNEY